MSISSVAISTNSGNLKNQASSPSSQSKVDDSNGQLKGAQNAVNVAVDNDVDTNTPINDPESAASANKVTNGECQTCKNRKYQDESDDSGVSYQTPTKLGGNVASAVLSHEQEHVSRNQTKADQEDRRIVSQSVTLHSAICPECGKSYVSGGTTRTVTAADRSATEDSTKRSSADELAVSEAIANDKGVGVNLDFTA